jgi:hypothetical protein
MTTFQHAPAGRLEAERLVVQVHLRHLAIISGQRVSR